MSAKVLILFSFPINLFCLPPHVFGCTCFVHILTPNQDKLSAKATKCIFFGYSVIPASNEVTDATLLIHIDTSFSLMSHFLNILPSSLPHLLPVLRSYLYLSSFPFRLYHMSPSYSNLTITSLYSPPARLAIGPFDRLISMAPSSVTPLLPSPGDLPITLRKGTHSTSNRHPIYNFLTYHPLSSPYFAFVSTLSSVSVPQTVHEVLSHPG